jgi:hypothetical protein
MQDIANEKARDVERLRAQLAAKPPPGPPPAPIPPKHNPVG